VLILSEAHLRKILSSYAKYYNQARTHLALKKIARYNGRSNGSVGSPPFPSWPGYILIRPDLIFGKDKGMMKSEAIRAPIERGLEKGIRHACSLSSHFGKLFPNRGSD
jgi:hypothetical protein